MMEFLWKLLGFKRYAWPRTPPVAAAVAQSRDAGAAEPQRVATLIRVDGSHGQVLINFIPTEGPPRVWASLPVEYARQWAYQIWAGCKAADVREKQPVAKP